MRQHPHVPSKTAGAAAPHALSDDDLAVFLGMSGEFLAVFDFDQGLVWGSPGAAQVLGYRPDELVGMPVESLLDPEDRARIVQIVVSLAAGTRTAGGRAAVGTKASRGAESADPVRPPTATFETRFRHRDGSHRWLEWSGSMHPTGLLYGAARDVTERHEARVALRTGERLVQAIIDHSASAIFVKDLEERYVLVNEAFLRPLNLQREQVIGRTRLEIWGQAVPAEDHIDRQVMESGTSITRDDVVTLPDGPHTMLTVRFPLRHGDEVVGMGAIATDITDRTDVEAALAERERLLDTIVRACPDIVTMLDRNGRVVEVSQASTRILGYDLAHPVHEELEALIHPDDLQTVYAEHAKLLTLEKRHIDIRYRVRHKLGYWVTLDTRGQAIVGPDGRPAGAMIVSRDITSDLAFEEELQAALAAAEQASTAKSEFLSRMSHELRTPLNSVLGFAQLLEMEELQGEQSEAVGHILRAGHHLLNLIDEVLDIARIESGRLDLVLDAVDLHGVVADAVDLTRPLADDRGVALDVELRPSAAGHVEADRQRLMQVLLNLLSNGVKYNRAGGSVTVTVARGDGRTVLSVADTGPGIDEADMARLFAPFDRLGAERSGVQGTGVGLTLSKHLVEEMGGTISVQSVPGAGSTFLVDLRTAEPPKPAPASRTPQFAGARTGDGMRVLHIEDNLANLELIEQVLARAGSIELLAAMYGGLGLELAREHHPDLVLLDLHLPDMTGAEVLRALQDDPGTADIPVVVVSADATPAQVQRLRGSGVMAYLTKPVDVRELLRVVELVGAGSSR